MDSAVPAATFLSRYVDYASALTSAPEDYHAAVGFGILAAAVRRNIWINFTDDRLFPNLWICLIGQSGIMAKSTSINVGVRLLRRLGEDVLYPSDFSLQRLYDVMKQRPQGTLIYRELKALTGLLERDYMSGAKAVLTDAYDNPPCLDYDTRGAGLVKIDDPSLTIIAASTPAWWTSKDTQRDLDGGFLARFLFIPASPAECPEWTSLPEQTPETLRQKDNLCAELGNIAQARGRIRLGTYDKSVYDDWAKWHRQESRLRERYAPWLVRYEVLALKLTMLLHLAEGRDCIDQLKSTTMLESCQIVNRWEQRLVTALEGEVAFTAHEEVRNRVFRLIPNGDGEISQRDLCRAARLPLRDLEGILRLLQAEGRLTRRFEKASRGDKTIVYWRRETDA